MAGSLDGTTIKKEIEDSLDSPENADTQDSGQGQSEGQSNQKLTKVWGEDETRSLIELAKVYVPKCKDSSYTRKHLLEDISSELQLIGYDCTPENVRNKLKYLRSRYKGFVDYNSKHAQKRTMLYSDELSELYSLDYFEDQDFHGLSNGSSDSKGSSSSAKKGQKSSTIPASHVDLRTVVTSSKKRPAPQVVQRSSKVVAKKGSKNRCQPLFQCGLCMQKFKTSYDMHGHACNTPTKANESTKKKAAVPPSPPSSPFHWNSLITMQLLELLKQYQESHKNSNFRKGNVWVQMSGLMKRKGHSIPPSEIEKKWQGLANAFEKTLLYNRTHKDKKKCAFYNRLSELHRYPGSFSAFLPKEPPPVRMTVEVSPFSFSSSSAREEEQQQFANQARPNPQGEEPHHKSQQNGSNQELIRWLDATWAEWKELERRREEERVQRHNEVMEMMAYLIECSGGNRMR